MTPAWIALGGNLGDRARILEQAVDRLRQRGLEVVHVSRFYETRPEGGREEPLYLNAVLEGKTASSPGDLLQMLRETETELGRGPEARTGPRTCDLDLLSFGDLVLEKPPDMVLPHPRLHRRSFVLVPLCELDVHWRHPKLQRSAGELLAELPTQAGEVRLHTTGG